MSQAIKNDFVYKNNVLQAPKNIRLDYIRKVYGLIAIEMVFTLNVIAFFMYTTYGNEFVKDK